MEHFMMNLNQCQAAAQDLASAGSYPETAQNVLKLEMLKATSKERCSN